MKTKFYLAILLLFASVSVSAQSLRILDVNEYDQLKRANQLPEKYMVKATEGSETVIMPRIQPSATSVQSNALCNCLVPLDPTFSVVPFSSGVAPDYRNDDGCSPAIVLPFSYCFFGQAIDTVYINNNGNISFHGPRFNFISDSFPNSTYTMIAPLWADVDTRGALSGMVYYKVTPTAMIIKWEHVGYFPMRDNKLNTYQVIITNGSDPMVPVGNTAICYGDMQWTTGGGGFGGAGATAGTNAGNGTNYIQFGRFNGPGHTYDGPFGAPDSVDWLDSSSFQFDLCPSNVPPVTFDCNVDTVFLRVGDVADFTISFLAPEFTQATSISVNPGSLTNFTTLNNTSGNMARFAGQLVASSSNIGMNTVIFTATDNGVPAQSQTISRVFHIEQATGIQQNNHSSFFSFSPNPFTDQTILTISGLNGKDNLMMTIVDVAGREVKRADHIQSSMIIEKGSLSKGIYTVHLSDGNTINETAKLIIQ